MRRSIRRGHRILMARGKLGVLLMALLLAVSRPKREWIDLKILAIGVTCFGVLLPKNSSTLTRNPKMEVWFRWFSSFNLGDFFVSFSIFQGLFFPGVEILTPKIPTLDPSHRSSYWTRSSDPEALVKRVYAMEMALEVTEPRLELQRLYVSVPETNSYQPVRPWKSMVGILRYSFPNPFGAKRPIFRVRKASR